MLTDTRSGLFLADKSDQDLVEQPDKLGHLLACAVNCDPTDARGALKRFSLWLLNQNPSLTPYIHSSAYTSVRINIESSYVEELAEIVDTIRLIAEAQSMDTIMVRLHPLGKDFLFNPFTGKVTASWAKDARNMDELIKKHI